MTSQAAKAQRSSHGDMLDVFVQNCRRNGLKITPQRTAVYKTLIKSKEHPSAEMVWGQVRRLLSGDIAGYGESNAFDACRNRLGLGCGRFGRRAQV